MVGRRKREREGRLFEAVVGERLAALREVFDGETGFVLEKLEFVDDAGDGVAVGRPIVRLSEPPTIAAFLDDLKLFKEVQIGERMLAPRIAYTQVFHIQ